MSTLVLRWAKSGLEAIRIAMRRRVEFFIGAECC